MVDYREEIYQLRYSVVTDSPKTKNVGKRFTSSDIQWLLTHRSLRTWGRIYQLRYSVVTDSL